MLRRNLRVGGKDGNVPREGDLYARITHGGRTFEIFYGYYEECDRKNPLVDPVPIYPNFAEHPQYNNEGYPFITQMQDACEHYVGKERDDGCYGCEHYSHAAYLIGTCTCEKRRKKNSSYEF